jgi:hypothetical protein
MQRLILCFWFRTSCVKIGYGYQLDVHFLLNKKLSTESVRLVGNHIQPTIDVVDQATSNTHSECV